MHMRIADFENLPRFSIHMIHEESKKQVIRLGFLTK